MNEATRKGEEEKKGMAEKGTFSKRHACMPSIECFLQHNLKYVQLFPLAGGNNHARLQCAEVSVHSI